MKELNFEQMEKVNGGDKCSRLLRRARKHGDSIRGTKTKRKYLDHGCNPSALL